MKILNQNKIITKAKLDKTQFMLTTQTKKQLDTQ